MRPATRLLLAFSMVLLACVAGFWHIHARNLRACWPAEQSRRCAQLSSLVAHYHDTHGSYPKTLDDVLDGQSLPASAYEALLFQESPWSARTAWQYHPPSAAGDAILFSGRACISTTPDEALFIFGWPDGTTQQIARKDLAWHLKRSNLSWPQPTP